MFQDAEKDAGRIGLIIVLCGMCGSMVCGIILDKTHAYKSVKPDGTFKLTSV